MGLPGKPDGIDGSEVAQYHRDGRIQEIANYCETDVVNTYRIWLRYELFRCKLTIAEFETTFDGVLRGRNERLTANTGLEDKLRQAYVCRKMQKQEII